MFPIKKFQYPNEEGKFGAIRKYDIHTGIDLYCEENSEVLAIEDGVVINIEDFTGIKANSPWWFDTMAVLVEGKSGVIVYGEIEPTIKIGEVVIYGQLIGKVKRVLKKDKGKPTSMLHLELYKSGTKNTVWWKLGKDKPEELLDPTFLVKQ